LRALQQAQNWLSSQQLADAPALWQSLHVDEQWRQAVEVVLGERLAARAGQR
jgi:chromosome segregation protein